MKFCKEIIYKLKYSTLCRFICNCCESWTFTIHKSSERIPKPKSMNLWILETFADFGKVHRSITSAEMLVVLKEISKMSYSESSQWLNRLFLQTVLLKDRWRFVQAVVEICQPLNSFKRSENVLQRMKFFNRLISSTDRWMKAFVLLKIDSDKIITIGTLKWSKRKGIDAINSSRSKYCRKKKERQGCRRSGWLLVRVELFSDLIQKTFIKEDSNSLKERKNVESH